MFKLLEERISSSRLAVGVRGFLVFLIIVNFTALLLEDWLIKITNEFWLQGLEQFSLAVFLIEYLLRVWSCTAYENKKRSRLKVRIKFILQPVMILDLLVLLPFLFSLGIDLRLIRIIRLMRVFKLARHSLVLDLIKETMTYLGKYLWMLVVLWLFALSFSASLMYYVEGDAQPEVFNSLTASFWWAVTTLTTVGYGDIVPVTPLGRFLGGILQVFGVLVLAFSSGLLGASFVEQMHIRRSKKESFDDAEKRRKD